MPDSSYFIQKQRRGDAKNNMQIGRIFQENGLRYQMDFEIEFLRRALVLFRQLVMEGFQNDIDNI